MNESENKIESVPKYAHDRERVEVLRDSKGGSELLGAVEIPKPAAVFSAPGKALVTGGYLVLFPEYLAFSVGLSCRMYAACYPTESPNNEVELEISSPQFDSSWKFTKTQASQSNPFLTACYRTVCTYFNRPIGGRIVLYSDSGFHSQQSATQNYYFNRFSYHGKSINDVPKTGLGSSAALAVVVVAALARLASADPLTAEQLHNLAQIAHCFAQGKIGSGFDVATAVYGTIVYSRFNPSFIASNMEDHSSVKLSVDSQWDSRHDKTSLPENIHILMGDVFHGSQTPGMVKGVLAWKEQNPEVATTLFQALNDANLNLIRLLKETNIDNGSAAAAILQIRRHLQDLMSKTKVSIEPASQTELLDNASQVPGVIGGVVPGAGGEDAVCVIVNTTIAPMKNILEGLNKIAGVTWMNLVLESSGLKEENSEEFCTKS